LVPRPVRKKAATSDLVLGMVPRGHTEAHMAKSEPGGRILSAGREEAARELIWRANIALVERLLSIMNQEDNPELSAIDNQRRRYARILWGMAAYFRAIGHDKLPELGTHIASLGVALEGLIRGVTDPLFVTKGSKRDSMRTWGARQQAALGLECWIKSDLSRETAASDAARNYKALARLKRGTNRDLKGSLLSWYDGYVEGRVPVPELLEAFQETRRAIRAANLSPAEYRRIGEQYFAQAVKTATR
jgi:hypothetical protein